MIKNGSRETNFTKNTKYARSLTNIYLLFMEIYAHQFDLKFSFIGDVAL